MQVNSPEYSDLLGKEVKFENIKSPSISSKLEKLPKDVLLYMVLDMNIGDILKLCKTKKYFNDTICNNRMFWMNKSIRDFPSLDQKDGGLYNRIRSNVTITDDELKNMDMKKLQTILLNVLDYLHYIDPNIETENIYVNREDDNNQTKFERLGNEDLLGVKSKNPIEGAFILNLLRLKVDKNAYPLIGAFENETYETKTVNLDIKKLSALLSEISDIDTIEPSSSTEIWDYETIRNWLQKDFLRGKYTGLGGIKLRKDLK